VYAIKGELYDIADAAALRVFVNYSNDTHVTLLCQDAE